MPWGSADSDDSLGRRTLGPAVRLYALVEAGQRQAIDVYLREEDAQRELEDCLRDEPEWRGLLRVERSNHQILLLIR
jgi:hypothetical protein